MSAVKLSGEGENLFDPAQETQSIVLIRAVNVFFSSEQQGQGIYISFCTFHIHCLSHLQVRNGGEFSRLFLVYDFEHIDCALSASQQVAPD